MQDLEVSPLTPSCNASLLVSDRVRLPKPGETVSIYFDFVGPKIYVDVAWKTRPGQGVARPGLRVYLAFLDDHGGVADVLISATSLAFSSAI
jgi:hypothetical protein